MEKLKIAQNFTLPIEAVTQTFAILAKRGVGKTYLGCVMAEEMLKAGLPVVIADPVGVWWGLRASADGKKAGLPITILGGDHGDLPLEVTAGKVIANLVVDERLSVVLDLSGFRKAEQTRFMTDFAETIYYRNRDPLHIIFDEADAFAPQRPMKGQERMLGAIEDIVRRGRARGLGVTLITQRAAVLNKNVLTQIEVLVPLRTISPQDRAAIEAWVHVHGTTEECKVLMASLPSLPIGTAWFWSPGWLDVLKKVKVRKKETYDSSATPSVMKKMRAPKKLADVDIEGLRALMAETIEKARADDPRELRREIAGLKKELANKTVEVKKIPILTDEVVTAIKDVVAALSVKNDELQRIQDNIEEFKKAMLVFLEKAAPAAADPTQSKKWISPPKKNAAHETHPTEGMQDLKKCERSILIVLAQYSQGRTKTQVALLSGYSHKSGGFNNSLSALRTKGFMVGSADNLQITEEGKTALGSYDFLPTGQELLLYWDQKLNKCAREILRVLAVAYPSTMTKQDVAEQTGYSAGSGGFNNALSKLRTLELINRDRDMRASDVFFE